jgi:hypothetical protein
MKSYCDVCGNNKVSVGKFFSPLMPSISFDYCQKCAESGAEPYINLVAVSSMIADEEIKSINDFEDDFICKVIVATLEATGITEEDFVSDVNDELRAQKEEDFLWEHLDLDDDDDFFK